VHYRSNNLMRSRVLHKVLGMVQDIGCKLVLLTDRKSHTGFQLVSKEAQLPLSC